MVLEKKISYTILQKILVQNKSHVTMGKFCCYITCDKLWKDLNAIFIAIFSDPNYMSDADHELEEPYQDVSFELIWFLLHLP